MSICSLAFFGLAIWSIILSAKLYLGGNVTDVEALGLPASPGALLGAIVVFSLLAWASYRIAKSAVIRIRDEGLLYEEKSSGDVDSSTANASGASTGFRVVSRPRSSEPFSAYYFDIFLGDRLVAEYWHDYRGDDHGITLIGRENAFPFRSPKEQYPLSISAREFLEGGGPTPLKLTDKAVALIDDALSFGG